MNSFNKLDGNTPKYVTTHRLVYACTNKITPIPSSDVDQADIFVSHIIISPTTFLQSCTAGLGGTLSQ